MPRMGNCPLSFHQIYESILGECQKVLANWTITLFLFFSNEREIYFHFSIFVWKIFFFLSFIFFFFSFALLGAWCWFFHRFWILHFSCDLCSIYRPIQVLVWLISIIIRHISYVMMVHAREYLSKVRSLISSNFANSIIRVLRWRTIISRAYAMDISLIRVIRGVLG